MLIITSNCYSIGAIIKKSEFSNSLIIICFWQSVWRYRPWCQHSIFSYKVLDSRCKLMLTDLCVAIRFWLDVSNLCLVIRYWPDVYNLVFSYIVLTWYLQSFVYKILAITYCLMSAILCLVMILAWCLQSCVWLYSIDLISTILCL